MITRAELLEMADERGEIACTTNTHDIIYEAEAAGLLKCISGKFKCVEPGTLNSMYVVLPERIG